MLPHVKKEWEKFILPFYQVDLEMSSSNFVEDSADYYRSEKEGKDTSERDTRS
jgi:hypothetical protein